MEVIHCNNFEIVRFLNHPVPSNAYLVINNDSKECVVIDPGSKEQHEIKDFIVDNRLKLKFILLTHEHFDHCWGVNFLLNAFPAKLVASKACEDGIKRPLNYFNMLYFNSSELYKIDKVDLIVEDIFFRLDWGNTYFSFIESKGHTKGSVCISFNDFLFSGDTMIYKTNPVLKNKFGASFDELKQTIDTIYKKISFDSTVLPGHGDSFKLSEMNEFFNNYFK